MDARFGSNMSEGQRGTASETQRRHLSLPNQLISYVEEHIGVIFITGRGFWNDDIVHEHFLELRRMAAVARRKVACVRVLVDLRGASVQSPMVAARIEYETRHVWSDADRIAVVLQSTLAKMQINRVVDSGNHASFIAIEDAWQWLGLRPCPVLENRGPSAGAGALS